MWKIAVLGGNGYLGTIIKNHNNNKKIKFTFFSRKKKTKNYLNYFSFKKNINKLKDFDIILHLAGPNQNQLKKNQSLLKKKLLITSNICDLCLANNIKLIYLSSMQVYKDYGLNNISLNSKINYKNYYSRSHYESEKIIIKKFLNHKKMFTILRMGNVFGFKKYDNLNKMNDNLIHSLSISALKKKKILIQNGSVQRSFIPSEIFVNIINSIVKINYFKNSKINISYKILNLKEVAQLIQKRLIKIFNFKTEIIIKKFNKERKYKIKTNQIFEFKSIDNKINKEIDRILSFIKIKKRK